MIESKVYCIIVTFNAMKWVDKCFSSLRNSHIPIIPVVIDNGSKDETVNYIKTNYPEAHIILNEQNKGFGQANNQGIEWAYHKGATHFFLLNQDAWIEPDAISNLIEIQDKNNIDVAAPIHLNGVGDSVDFGYYEYLQFEFPMQSLFASALKHELHEYYPIEFVNAAGWVISRDTVETIGGFDPIFFHYGEDRNYTQRLKYHKKSFAIIPSSIMYHDRVQHGNEQVYNKKRVISTLLKEYADVNKHEAWYSHNRIKLQLWLFRDVIKYIIKFNVRTTVDLLNGFKEFYSKKGQILESLKHNKEVKSNWLNILE